MLKSKIGYAMLLLFVIIFCLFYSELVVLLILMTVVAIPVIMLFPVVIAVAKLKVKLQTKTLMVQNGDEAEACIVVSNRSCFDLSYLSMAVVIKSDYTGEKIKQKYLFSVKRYSTTEVILKVKASHCGKLNLRILRVCGHEVMRVLAFAKRSKEILEVYVMPKPSIIEQDGLTNLPDDEGSVYSKVKRGEDYAQTFDYHIYHEGDKIKHINWKLSSKQEEMMVREGSLPLSSRACILIEQNIGNDFFALDSLLSLAAGLSDDFIINEIPHDVCVYSKEDECCRFVNVSSLADFYYAMTILYNTPIPKEKQERVLSELANGYKEISYAKYARTIYIAGELLENSIQSLMLLRQKSEVSVFISNFNAEENTYLQVEALFEDADIELNRIYKK